MLKINKIIASGYMKLLVVSTLVLSSYLYGLLTYKYQLPPFELLRSMRDQTAVIVHSSDIEDKISVKAYRQTYFDIDAFGHIQKNQEYERGESYYKINDGLKSINTTFANHDTAIIIMDAWEDSGSDFLNEQYRPIFYEKIYPLIQAFIEKDFNVFAFTEKESVAPYGVDLYPELEELINQEKVVKVHHVDEEIALFKKAIDRKNITNLIYLGYASNICIIGRNVGIFEMRNEGFNTYFVPEASAAVEREDTWNTKEVHSITTSIISQNSKGIIAYDALLNALKK